MARIKTFDEPAEEYKEEAPVVQTPVVPAGPVPGTVEIINLCACEVDLHLTDATTVPLGPKAGGRNIATGIPKKLLPPYIHRLAAQGKLRINDLGR